jgi:hypothetical protein
MRCNSLSAACTLSSVLTVPPAQLFTQVVSEQTSVSIKPCCPVAHQPWQFPILPSWNLPRSGLAQRFLRQIPPGCIHHVTERQRGCADRGGHDAAHGSRIDRTAVPESIDGLATLQGAGGKRMAAPVECCRGVFGCDDPTPGSPGMLPPAFRQRWRLSPAVPAASHQIWCAGSAHFLHGRHTTSNPPAPTPWHAPDGHPAGCLRRLRPPVRARGRGGAGRAG